MIYKEKIKKSPTRSYEWYRIVSDDRVLYGGL